MARRLVYQFPKTYDSTDMGKFVYAINQVIADLETQLKGGGGGQTAAVATATGSIGGAITITEVINNLAIGRGTFFELIVIGTDCALTGISGGVANRIIILKNSFNSSNSLPLIPDSTSSALGNRFITRNAANLTIGVGAAYALIYSEPNRSWIPIASVP